MRLPDFLIIGAQKSGTTWLKEQLRHHPRIFMPEAEVHFFDRPDNFARGPEWYARQFSSADAEDLVGEKTPGYLHLSQRANVPDGVHRIHGLLPDAKLIVIFREPVQRALSALNHLIHKQQVSPLHSSDALLLGRKRHLLPWPVIDMGIYDRQLESYLDVYARDAILALYHHELVEAPGETVAKVLEFLGVPAETRPDQLRRRSNQPRCSRVELAVRYYAPSLMSIARHFTWRLDDYYPRLSEAGRIELHRFYEPHNERLFELLGRRPSSEWQTR